MRPVIVTWDDGSTTSTSINGTMEEIRAYYVGQRFNVGDGGNDRFLTAVDVVEPRSGYVDCACRDCMNPAISGDGKPALCGECSQTGCDWDGLQECASPTAYGMEESSPVAGWEHVSTDAWLTWWEPTGCYGVRVPNAPGCWKFEVLDNAGTPGAVAYPHLGGAVEAVGRLLSGIDHFSAE